MSLIILAACDKLPVLQDPLQPRQATLAEAHLHVLQEEGYTAFTLTPTTEMRSVLWLIEGQDLQADPNYCVSTTADRLQCIFPDIYSSMTLNVSGRIVYARTDFYLGEQPLWIYFELE